MKPSTDAVKRHPLVTFFALSYATFYFAMGMRELFPTDLWFLFIYGTFVAALLVSSIQGGPSARRELLSRMTRWRVGWYWYAIALGFPIALRLIAFGANLALEAPTPSASQLDAWPDMIASFLFTLIIVAVGEEPGFRGFALTRMLQGRSALSAALWMGVLVSGWHLPLFVTGNDPPTIIPVIIGGAVMITWVYINTNGSVLLTMLIHASVGATPEFFNELSDGKYETQQTVLLAIAYCVMAAVLVAVLGPSLKGRRLSPESATAPVASSTAS